MTPGRPKKLGDDVDRIQLSLAPEEQAVLQLIRAKRKKSGTSSRTNESQIVADGLWSLAESEGIPRDAVEKLIAPDSQTDNVREFRKKD